MMQVRAAREPERNSTLDSHDPMFETKNPEIDVDALMLRVRRRVSELEQGFPEPPPGKATALRNGVFINALEAFVNGADQKNQVRTQWPSHLGGVLFSNSKLRKSFLRLLSFVFKDQRHVNEALIMAFRESISLNGHLIEQLEALRREVDALKRVGSPPSPPR